MAGNDSTSKSTFHPAFSVSNIKNHIQITLEMENVHYDSWAELFFNVANAFDVADHIIPNADATVKRDAQWSRLDAIVKQWIYSTISVDLLHTILKPDANAQEAWNRLKDIFHDNKNSIAVYLEQQFSQIHMDNYPNASSYCQALKLIAEQLGNVGAPVSEDRLVLRLVTGLSSAYDSLVTIIQQLDPLSSFYKARTMLTLEETRRHKNTGAESALLHTQSDVSSATPNRSSDATPSRYNNRNTGGRGRQSRGKGNNNNQGNSYKNSFANNKNNSGTNNRQGSQPASWTWGPFTPPSWPQQPSWNPPPCPYPTTVGFLLLLVVVLVFWDQDHMFFLPKIRLLVHRQGHLYPLTSQPLCRPCLFNSLTTIGIWIQGHPPI